MALGAAVFFGVSLALGAFLAGVVVRESPMRHQIGADVLPFRDAFAVLFFVSVGMLVDPRALWSSIGPVLAISAVVVLGKGAFALGIALLLRQPVHTALVVAAGLAQVGEFSFILGQAALALGILAPEHYALVLAAALVSITLNPFAFRLIAPGERLLRRVGLGGPTPGVDPIVASADSPHVVVVGCGRVGHHVVDVLGRLGVPRLVIDLDAEKIEALRRDGIPALFGDAANSEILRHAGLGRARALVVTVGDVPTATIVVAGARQLAPELWTIARSSTAGGVRMLYDLGARTVIHPELEGGLEVVRHTLSHLGYPLREVQRYVDAVRRDGYDPALNRPGEHRALRDLVAAAGNLEVTWATVQPASRVAGRTLAQTNLRAQTGSIVVAIQRDGVLVPSPPADTPLAPGDRLALIGAPDQVDAAERLLGPDGSGRRKGGVASRKYRLALPPRVSPSAGEHASPRRLGRSVVLYTRSRWPNALRSPCGRESGAMDGSVKPPSASAASPSSASSPSPRNGWPDGGLPTTSSALAGFTSTPPPTAGRDGLAP